MIGIGGKVSEISTTQNFVTPRHELITPSTLLTGASLAPPEEYVVLVHGGAGAPNEEVARQREEGCRYAAHIGEYILSLGGLSPLDVALEVVAIMENDVNLIAGAGSGPNCKQGYEFDAFAATGNGEYGTAGAIAEYKKWHGLRGAYAVEHPVHVARLVYGHPRTHMVIGEGATDLARAANLPFRPHKFFDDAYRQGLESQYGILGSPPRTCDTVGAIIAARWQENWTIAAAGSTGGMPDKLRGRVGDCAVNGAGFRLRESSNILDTTVSRVDGALVSGVGEAAMRNLTAEEWVNARAKNDSVYSRAPMFRVGKTIIDATQAWGGIITLGIHRATKHAPSRNGGTFTSSKQSVQPTVYTLVPYFPVVCLTNITSTSLRIESLVSDRLESRDIPVTTSLVSTDNLSF